MRQGQNRQTGSRIGIVGSTHMLYPERGGIGSGRKHSPAALRDQTPRQRRTVPGAATAPERCIRL
jgi:hypothetical protein